ncbi:hypothetical protein AB0I54_43840 [Streptomyces sp. NPDC050625]|uniref:hypothetical protein n=1 Tax=Streptomyces sp. NPDC050625 TaxID=3154629 RepID=UPI003433186E
MTVLWGSSGGLTTGTDLPAAGAAGLEPLYYGIDIAAMSGPSGATNEVLVDRWHGSVRFAGPFSRTGTYGGSAVANESFSDSVGSATSTATAPRTM